MSSNPAVETALATNLLVLRSGASMPTLGVGSGKLTGRECESALRAALEIGYRHIDTAQAYDNQPEIGRALTGYDRSKLFITSKLWFGDYTEKKVPAAFDRILRELKCDYLDLLLIHWPDRSVPFAETLGAMQQLVEDGKLRSIGVSNFTIAHLEEALESAEIAVNQVEFHPFLNQSELLNFCTQHQIILTAYCPLGRGLVASNEELQKIGGAHSKTAAQVALRWLIQKGMAAIPKSSSPARLKENAAIFDFTLSPKEMQRIDALNEDRRLINPEWGDFN